ncbi:MAG TPA: hypothetical protein PKC28_06075, partial [Bdellovibrionales bacterium]|nr:hypothetical protein [Bdellovibrionales bacterium]
MNSRFLDYRQQVLDPVSKSFCAAKWLNATVWLDKGATTSCHHPPYHHVPLSQVLKDPSALHNTERKKEARRQMLSGERPKECDYCWKIEDAAPDAVSDRVFKSIIHAPGDLERISKPEAVENAVPRTLEISFGR